MWKKLIFSAGMTEQSSIGDLQNVFIQLYVESSN